MRCRPAVFLLLLMLAACGSAAAPGERASQRLASLADPALGEAVIAELAGLDRLPGSDGFEIAIQRLSDRLETAGFPALPALPGDGPADPMGPSAYHFVLRDSLPLPSWQGGPARLVVMGADGFIAADTRTTPMVLAYGSGATPDGGLVTDLVYLGNGTFDQEYEGVDVSGALVYGRRRLPNVARMALTHGAIGAVSPAAESWHDPAGATDMVTWGRVSGGAIGFKVSPDEALRLEAAMEEGGGRTRVRVEVASRSVAGLVRSTLVAEIPGTDPTLERVMLSAPFSGPAPGAGDASGAAALVEAAAALRQAIADGDLPRPRRTILFIWGAAVDGVVSWMRQFPTLATQLHSGTVVQLAGTPAVAGEPPLLVERVPDPAALWTRPPYAHTPWGASRPPSWPFEGHYLSELTGMVAGATRPLSTSEDTVRWRGHPFEGASDHVPLLEALVPAQRLWRFPYPQYRSSLDLPDRVDPAGIQEAAVVSASLAWTLARAEIRTARQLLIDLDRRARDRLDQVADQAAARLADGRAGAPGSQERRLEEQIANAWKVWYLEAFESVMGHPIGEEGNRLRGAVGLAIARLNRDWNERIGSMGLALLPVPERFLPNRRLVR